MAEIAAPYARKVGRRVDVEVVRRVAKARALAAGASLQTAGELELIVSELATNILRHTVGGEVVVSSGPCEGKACISVVATDFGPGIPDLVEAFSAGFSTGGGLGQGFSVIRRLADTFDVETGPGGTRIAVQKCTN
ncbi:MAG: ATP-binding protein [Tepidiformaceae bacterium]